MKLSKQQSKALKANLPENAVKKIHTKIDGKIGERMIQLILAGDQPDNHGVLMVASEMATAFKKAKEKTENRLKAISK